MAQSRIINYDGSYVTYYYERHEDGKRIEETIHVYDFIKLLNKTQINIREMFRKWHFAIIPKRA